MQNEMEILKWIEREENTTQRMIAKKIGISLGNVNIQINKLVERGMLRIERAGTRTIKYIITSEGIKKRTEYTYKKIISSYRLVKEFNKIINSFFCVEKINIYSYILYGLDDELFELIKKKLLKKNLNYRYVNRISDLKSLIVSDKAFENFNGKNILVWNPEKSEKLIENNIKHTNLFNLFNREIDKNIRGSF